MTNRCLINAEVHTLARFGVEHGQGVDGSGPRMRGQVVLVTFSGNEALFVGGGRQLIGLPHEGSEEIALGLVGGQGDLLWGPSTLALHSAPNSEFTAANSTDLVGAYWPANESVVLLGSPAAVVVSLADGHILVCQEMRYTEQASLDVASIDFALRSQWVVVSSSRRIWAIDRQLQKSIVMEPEALLTGPPLIEGSRIVYECYDFDGSAGATKVSSFELQS